MVVALALAEAYDKFFVLITRALALHGDYIAGPTAHVSLIGAAVITATTTGCLADEKRERMNHGFVTLIVSAPSASVFRVLAFIHVLLACMVDNIGIQLAVDRLRLNLAVWQIVAHVVQILVKVVLVPGIKTSLRKGAVIVKRGFL
jgi:hypothetical protein